MFLPFRTAVLYLVGCILVILFPHLVEGCIIFCATTNCAAFYILKYCYMMVISGNLNCIAATCIFSSHAYNNYMMSLYFTYKQL